jgi:hypothetical protein
MERNNRQNPGTKFQPFQATPAQIQASHFKPLSPLLFYPDPD